MSYSFTRHRLYLAFFKSTLVINIVVSFVVSMAFTDLAFFPVCFMTGGPLFSFFYKEVTHPNEYYFYHNRGISRYQLMGFTLAACVLLGVSTLIIISHVASS